MAGRAGGAIEALLNTRQTTATASESGAGVIVVGRLGHTIATRAGCDLSPESTRQTRHRGLYRQ